MVSYRQGAEGGAGEEGHSEGQQLTFKWSFTEAMGRRGGGGSHHLKQVATHTHPDSSLPPLSYPPASHLQYLRVILSSVPITHYLLLFGFFDQESLF